MATTKVTTDVIDMSGNAGGLTWVKGTTAQQPSGVIGEIREDTETKRTQVYTNQVGTPPTISTCDYPAGAGAQALYQFDTATLTTDTCGNYSAGTNNNVTQNTTVKKYGTSSAEFNGTTADIDLEAGLDSTTMSVSFWIYIDATITTNGVVVELENGYGVWFIASASGKLGVQNNNANNEATLSNAQLGTGAWHHVAAVWTGVGGSSNRTFYLDNVVQTGGTVSDYLTCNENTLGSRRSGEFFDGYLDQVRFYNTALTASQVDNLFNESSTSTGNEWRNLKEAAVVAAPFSVDFLIVAGGGGASGDISGGGGAGGLRTSYTNTSSLNGHNESSLSLSVATDYTLTIGPGGTGTNYSSTIGNNGADSTFSGSFTGSPITSTGGGGGSVFAGAAGNGGSGGGPRATDTPGLAVTSPVTQGYNGGASTGFGVTSSGGGGANQLGQTGGSANNTPSGDGGDGLEVNIIGGTGNFYAGGGGGGGSSSSSHNVPGGTGGTGGGGNGGGDGTSVSDGTPNTGGGGGGNDVNSDPGGTGGSGIVILRYPIARSAVLSGGATGSVDQPITGGTHKYAQITGSGTITFS